MALPPLFDISVILDACLQGQLILSANQRIKSKALEAWGQYQLEQGKQVWRAPRLLTLDQWLQQQWRELQNSHYPNTQVRIAQPLQISLLWERIIKQQELIQPEQIAQHAAAAYKNLLRWQLTPDCLSTYSANQHSPMGKQHRQFQQWCRDFEAQLEHKALITAEHSYTLIDEALTKGVLKQEDCIHLLGFDDIAPQLQQLLNHASTQLLSVAASNKTPVSCVRLEQARPQSEMKAATSWAKGIIEQEPQARIGIIVPNLGQCRDEIETALVHCFESHSLLPESERYTYPFNISAGTPLSATPLIYSTLEFLQLREKKWSVDRLCQFLQSPFWGNLDQEREARSRLAEKISSLGIFEIELNQLHYWSEKLRAEDEKGLFAYFEALRQLEQQSKPYQKRLPSQWLDTLQAQLACLNWPGQRQPDSHEYQQTEMWYQLLETFCGLDDTLGPINFTEAVSHCRRLAQHQPFQAKVPDSPIQVLGILEGAGLSFSHCWILGLDQQTWPPAPQPNPLLPVPLQRDYNMPHASSLRELEFAKSLTAHYRQCARHIVFSSARHDDSGEHEQLASQLIKDIPLDETTVYLADNDDLMHYRQKLRSSQQWESVDCQKGPALGDCELQENREIKGGTGVLRAQVNNPFDAFVKYRLNANPLTEAVSGFSPVEKGNILHKSMENIWKQLGNQQALLALDEGELEQCIHSSVTEQVDAIYRHKRQHLLQAVCAIEIERQSTLLLEWFNDVEKQRPPFSEVIVEKSEHLEFNNISFHVRLDRIDRLEDGSFLIIDYKSGKTSTNDWQGEKLREPQLPFYLITQTQVVSGITYAEINIKACRFNGLCRENIDSSEGQKPSNFATIAGIKPVDTANKEPPQNWQAVKEAWQQSISSTLNDFINGCCEINYLDTKAKQYGSAFYSLNRIYDQQRLTQLLPRLEKRTNESASRS